jgi:hypothetical protein
MKKLNILVFFVMISVLVSVIGVIAVGPVIDPIKFQYSNDEGAHWYNLNGDLINGFTLVTDGNADTNYLIKFDSSSISSPVLAPGLYGLYLIDSTVSKIDLKGYYSSKPDTPVPYKTYLDNAVDGLNPFAYIQGDGVNSLPVLLDAAQYDLPPVDPIPVPMVIPGNYPNGVYLIAGTLTGVGTDSPKSSIVLKLIVTNSINQPAQVIVMPDLSLNIEPNPLNFGTLKPGKDSTKSMTLTSGNSKLSITVNIIGDTLMQNILSDEQTSGNYLAYNGDHFLIANNTAKSFNTKLIVPTGTSSKTYTGTIIYTVLEAI